MLRLINQDHNISDIYCRQKRKEKELMASLKRNVSKYTGLVSWVVIFRKRVYEKERKVKKDLSYCATFRTEEEALKFIDEYEHVFALEDPGKIKYDRLMERRKRKFYHKIKDKT